MRLFMRIEFLRHPWSLEAYRHEYTPQWGGSGEDDDNEDDGHNHNNDNDDYNDGGGDGDDEVDDDGDAGPDLCLSDGVRDIVQILQ